MANKRVRVIVGSVAAVAVIVLAFAALSRFGILDLLTPPPRYDFPDGATADEERAARVAQDAVRAEHGRFVRLDRTTIFRNQLGNYRVRGAVTNPFSSNKRVFVYEAIVDSESFEILEFR